MAYSNIVTSCIIKNRAMVSRLTIAHAAERD